MPHITYQVDGLKTKPLPRERVQMQSSAHSLVTQVCAASTVYTFSVIEGTTSLNASCSSTSFIEVSMPTSEEEVEDTEQLPAELTTAEACASLYEEAPAQVTTCRRVSTGPRVRMKRLARNRKACAMLRRADRFASSLRRYDCLANAPP